MGGVQVGDCDEAVEEEEKEVRKEGREGMVGSEGTG